MKNPSKRLLKIIIFLHLDSFEMAVLLSYCVQVKVTAIIACYFPMVRKVLIITINITNNYFSFVILAITFSSSLNFNFSYYSNFHYPPHNLVISIIQLI